MRILRLLLERRRLKGKVLVTKYLKDGTKITEYLTPKGGFIGNENS